MMVCRGRACPGCRKEALGPLVQAEAIEVRRRSDGFQARVESFRSFFQKSAPFSVPDAELKLEHVRSPSFVSSFHACYMPAITLCRLHCIVGRGKARMQPSRPSRPRVLSPGRAW